MSIKLGNPAPLGLIAFGMTTAMLMFVEMEWAEHDFEVTVAGTALALGGSGQVLVAIFELLKGSSYSFCVFACYGFFWIGWSVVYTESARADSDFRLADYPDGKTLWFIQWGILTSCFWINTWRKNIALICVFFFLQMTFYLLAAATAQESNDIRKAAGYIGFITALGAFYTGVAELVNEEYGRHVLPGLKPLYKPHEMEITAESLRKQIDYDAKTNTLFLQFRGLQIKTQDHVQAVETAVETAILAAKTPDNKVHAVVDYQNATFADDVREAYWNMAQGLERKYYISATRFHVRSFGSQTTEIKA